MADEPRGLFKVGGISFIGSGLLFFVQYILGVVAGPPPSNGEEILAWTRSAFLPLALTSEVMFFAVGLPVPATLGLYCSLGHIAKIRAAVGCGLFAVTIPIMGMLLVVHGRLVYPIYGLRIATPDIAELVVALFYGGLHATNLLLGLGTVIISLAMGRGPYGQWLKYLGIVTGVFDVIGSYPWLIGSALALVSQVLFTAWFVAVGWKLYRAARGPRRSPTGRASS